MEKFLYIVSTFILLSMFFVCGVTAQTTEFTVSDFSYTTVTYYDFEDGNSRGDFTARTKSNILSNWKNNLNGFEPNLYGEMCGVSKPANNGQWGKSFLTLTVEPKSMYRLKFYFAAIADTKANCYIDLYEGNNDSDSAKYHLMMSEPQLEWIPMEISFETEDETSVTLRIRGDGGAPNYNLFLIDDVTLEKKSVVEKIVYDFEDGLPIGNNPDGFEVKDGSGYFGQTYPELFENINGKFCLYKTFSSGTPYTLGSFTVSPNTVYTVNMRISAGYSATPLYVYFYDGSNGDTPLVGTKTVSFSETQKWIEVSQVFTTPEDTSVFTLKVKSPSGNVFFFDDISIEASVSYEDENLKDTVTAFEEETYGPYGKLIWKQDFDNTKNIAAYSYDPSYNSPYADEGASLGNKKYIYSTDGDGSNPIFELVKNPVTGIGQALSMTGTTNYPIYKLVFGGKVLSKPGKYTFIINGYKGQESVNGRCRFYVNAAKSNIPEMGAINFGAQNFQQSRFSVNICTNEEFADSGIADNVFTKDYAYALNTIYLFMSGGNGKTCFFEDLELWYEEYADITFCIDAPNEEVESIINKEIPVLHKSYFPGTLLPKISMPGTGYSLVGWSKSKDNKSDIVTAAEAGTTTLYAVFEESNGYDLYPLDDSILMRDAIISIAGYHAYINGNNKDLENINNFEDYLSYAQRYNLLPRSAISHDRSLLRSEAAQMIYAVLDKENTEKINSIEAIPDILPREHYYSDVLCLYNAGILTGVNSKGDFDPYSEMLLCDFQTVMSRLLYNDMRIRTTLSPEGFKETIQLEKNTEKEFEASFIKAPDSYLSTLEKIPESTLTMGKWTWPYQYTRVHMRKDFSVNKVIKSAFAEFQCDNPFDLYVNGKIISSAENEDGWYLTGLTDVSSYLTSGTNKLAVRAYGTDEVMKYSSGFRGCLQITYTDGTVENIDTSTGWKSYLVCNFWEGMEPFGWEISDNPGKLIMTKVMEMHPRLSRRSCYFRKGFSAEKEIESAVLYATAKGLYVPYINGERVTESRFLPGSMMKIQEYQVFDVSDYVKIGNNVIASVSGNGWYNCASWGELYPNVPEILMQLEIVYKDGTTELIVTNETWDVTSSPLIENDIQYGERYDARLEISGWNSSADSEGEWVKAENNSTSNLTFSQQTYPAVKVRSEVGAVSMGILPDGVTRYYDFLDNSSGRAKIVLKDTKPGEMIVIRYCETFTDDMKPNLALYGDVYFPDDSAPGGKAPYFARNIDVYICKGAEEEIYEPEFAYTGFRYIYISGYSGEYKIGTVRKIEMHTDLEEVGDIETSNEYVSKIWDAVKRSYRSNAFTGPTDCPTREKNFWNGDIQAFASTACWYMDNNKFLERWTESGRKMQYDVYGWEDEEYILPLILYKYYGNTDVIESKYPVVEQLIAKRESKLTSGTVLPEGPAPYSDHNAIKKVPNDFFAAAYFCYMYKGASEMAQILGKHDDAAEYEAKFEILKQAFNEKYYIESENDYSPKCQAGIVLPVVFGLAKEEHLDMLVEKLNDYVVSDEYHLTTGFMSSEHILRIMCDYGYEEAAWRAITNPEYPSILNMVLSSGGTTTENWSGRSTGASSNNHYAVGGISRWFFECLGGIRITSPGFSTVDIKPCFYKDAGDCRVTYKSSYGLIVSEWIYDSSENVFNFTITIPDGIQATVMLDGFETETITGATKNYVIPG